MTQVQTELEQKATEVIALTKIAEESHGGQSISLQKSLVAAASELASLAQQTLSEISATTAPSKPAENSKSTPPAKE